MEFVVLATKKDAIHYNINQLTDVIILETFTYNMNNIYNHNLPIMHYFDKKNVFDTNILYSILNVFFPDEIILIIISFIDTEMSINFNISKLSNIKCLNLYQPYITIPDYKLYKFYQKEKMRYIYLILILIVYTKSVYAYLDPGTGSLVIQSVIAIVAGAIFTIKIYWSRVKGYFFKDNKEEKEDIEEQE